MNLSEARAVVEASLSRPTSTPNTSELPDAVFLDAEKAKLRSKLLEPFEVVAEPGTWAIEHCGIERTSSSKLRLLPAAAEVKR